jgi:hypothetical protein
MCPFILSFVLAQAPALAPQLDDRQIRDFLLTARVVSVKTLSKGTTRPRRVTLTDGTITHDAVFQTVDETRPVQRFASGRIELDFRDSWRFNIAAYEMAKLVGLEHMVPAAVERRIKNELGSLVWWVDWKWDEQMRVKQKLRPPDIEQWKRQWEISRVFRELVDDSDRNQTNMLITEDWRLWLVDFSRAFRASSELRQPQILRRCDRRLLERLRRLQESDVRRVLGTHLPPREIDALLARRALLVQHFDALASSKGADNVLF